MSDEQTAPETATEGASESFDDLITMVGDDPLAGDQEAQEGAIEGEEPATTDDAPEQEAEAGGEAEQEDEPPAEPEKTLAEVRAELVKELAIAKKHRARNRRDREEMQQERARIETDRAHLKAMRSGDYATRAMAIQHLTGLEPARFLSEMQSHILELDTGDDDPRYRALQERLEAIEREKREAQEQEQRRRELMSAATEFVRSSVKPTEHPQLHALLEQVGAERLAAQLDKFAADNRIGNDTLVLELAEQRLEREAARTGKGSPGAAKRKPEANTTRQAPSLTSTALDSPRKSTRPKTEADLLKEAEDLIEIHNY